MKNKTINKTIIHKRVFSVLLISLILFQLVYPLYNVGTNVNYSDTDIKLNSNIIIEKTPEIAAQGDTRYIIIADDPIEIQTTTRWESVGGIVHSGYSWNSIHAFVGTIDLADLSTFESTVVQTVEVYEDSILETQMNTVQRQIRTYPYIIDGAGFGLDGDSTSSTAVLDTGIDDSHVMFNGTYVDQDFSETILGWNDFLNGEVSPSDINGHGTSLSAIIAGGGADIEVNHTGDSYYMTLGGEYEHNLIFEANSPGSYNVKLGSLNITTINSVLTIDSTLTQNGALFDDYQLDLYRDGVIIESDLDLDLTHTITEGGVFDIYLNYVIYLTKSPKFELFVNVSFTPNDEIDTFGNFTGVAPQSRLVSLKILNDTGLGFCSDLISALDWVYDNNDAYHIASTLLSFGTFDISIELSNIISGLITDVIDDGTMVIIAAGNKQDVTANAFNELAKNPKAIVVGAMNDKDQITYYSSQGSSERTPDILAPGGSPAGTELDLNNSHQMIITADSNSPDTTGSFEINTNDLTCTSGTSISAAIVAGIYNLILEEIGGWSNYNQTEGHDALRIKSLMIMTATETNQDRPNNPFVLDDDEKSKDINLDYIIPDIDEGFGRINPEAILDLLTTTYTIDDEVSTTLQASTDNPWGQHIYATNLTLVEDLIYKFNVSTTGTLDADVFLYSPEHTENGYPILEYVQFDTNEEDAFYYTQRDSAETHYLAVKAASGSGNMTLNVSNVVVTLDPLLNNQGWESLTSDYDDYLDTYEFRINYSQPENFAPNEIFLKTDNKNITMVKEDGFDFNYEDGCFYVAEYDFEDILESYNYSFYTHVGGKSYQTVNFTIDINELEHYIDLPTYNYSTNLDNVDDWEYLPETELISYSGWNWIRMYDLYDDRDGDEEVLDTWNALYCGVTTSVGHPTFNSTFTNDNDPIYTYDQLARLSNQNNYLSYNLISPQFYVDGGLTDSPMVKMGLRVSVDVIDNFQIQIRSNRSSWESLEIFTGTEQDWFLAEYNLTEYENTYIQFRLQSNIFQNQFFQDFIGRVRDNGFMLDYFELSNKNVNVNAPELLSGYVGKGFESDSKNANDTKFENYHFEVTYTDVDGDYPEYVYLEIDGTNYTMQNKYGDWSPEDGIIFDYNMNIIDKIETNFTFHAYDGEKLASPEKENGPTIDSIIETVGLPFTSDYEAFDSDYMIIGEPVAKSESKWLNSENPWHKLVDRNSYYCGIGEFMGYGYGWDTSFILPAIHLDAEYEDIILQFNHYINLDDYGIEGGDYGEIMISINEGVSWDSLQKFDTTTEFDEDITIDLTKYRNEFALIRFRFVSDFSGLEQTEVNGWEISDFVIDINSEIDYFAPTVNFDSLKENEKVSGTIKLIVNVVDNEGLLPASNIKFYVDGKRIDIEEYYNGESGNIIIDIDTTKYENGDLEIAVIAEDAYGNEIKERIIIKVQNPIYAKTEFIYGIIIIGVLLGLLVLQNNIKKKRNTYNLAAGDDVDHRTYFERIKVDRENKARRAEEVKENLDIYKHSVTLEEWEKDEPYYLHCGSCKAWFKGPEFDLYCPSCGADSMMLAKQCPICYSVNYFESYGTHECTKCDISLVKDYDNLKHQIKEINVLGKKTMTEITDEKIKEVETVEQRIKDLQQQLKILKMEEDE